MRVLQVDVSDETAARIEKAARDRGLTMEQLVRESVEEKLARETEFENAAKRVLEKNADLYERLS